MQANHTPNQSIAIHRHCMQQLLHEAISCDPDHCFGFLTGSGNVVKNSVVVTENMLSDSEVQVNSDLMGVYLCSRSNENTDCGRSAQLARLFARRQGVDPAFYLLIELQHKGRVDVHLFADAGLSQPLVLEMQEDTACTLPV